jgi:hypothetical protein
VSTLCPNLSVQLICNDYTCLPHVFMYTARPNSALVTDAFHSALRAARGAAKRER